LSATPSVPCKPGTVPSSARSEAPASSRYRATAADSTAITTIPTNTGTSSAGKAKIRTEGEDFYVKPGDIVCTRAGDEHDVLEVYEDLEAFWFEDPCPTGGRIGHLHRSPELAAGHPVPYLPVPKDFPI
jgi:hypothetical protein